MSSKLPSRTTPLTANEKQEFFKPDGHLAYRRTMLLTHRNLVRQQQASGIPVSSSSLTVSVEASCIAIRNFIQFLGLGAKPPGLVLEERRQYEAFNGQSHEVKVVDLGGTFVAKSTLSTLEQDLLAKFYDGIGKATAHLTYNSGHQLDWTKTHDAVDLVDRLLDSHLYQVVGQTPHLLA